MRAATALAVVALVVAAASAPRDAAADDVHYRYTVLGYVTDARGAPVAGEKVLVVRDKTGLAYHGETDEHGFYLVLTRLEDEADGETITVTIGRARTRVTARFDPANHTDERGTRLDLERGRWRDRAAWFPSTLARALGASTERPR